MHRVGVLDLGTNTFRLLIAGRTPHHKLRRDLIERRIVRMGEGFVEKGNLSGAAVVRAQKALEEFSSLLRREGVHQALGVATGVFREAENAAQVIEELSRAFAFPIQRITGIEEGAHTLNGVVAGLDVPGDSEYLILDIGGGSTEFVHKPDAGKVRIKSVPLGAVYLKERFGGSVLSDSEVCLSMQQWIDEALENVFSTFESPRTMSCIGTGGTITTLSYMNLGLERYEGDRIHGSTLASVEVEAIVEEAWRCSAEEIGRRYRLEKGRADLVLFGGTLLMRILWRLSAPSLWVSDYGLLEGLALEMLDN